MASGRSTSGSGRRIYASKHLSLLDADGHPQASAWESAGPIHFDHDWQGRNADPARRTEVRILWSDEFLFLRFVAHYREIYTYPGGNTRRDELWLRDVAEVFLRPGAGDPSHYREFEISPNGDWLDLDIFPGGKSDLGCNMRSRVSILNLTSRWIAELAFPAASLGGTFEPGEVWRVNFFRVEGPEPRRFYSSWQPTHSLRPNFHVPEAFGELYFL
jgi:hypothetical protein